MTVSVKSIIEGEVDRFVKGYNLERPFVDRRKIIRPFVKDIESGKGKKDILSLF